MCQVSTVGRGQWYMEVLARLSREAFLAKYGAFLQVAGSKQIPALPDNLQTIFKTFLTLHTDILMLRGDDPVFSPG